MESRLTVDLIPPPQKKASRSLSILHVFSFICRVEKCFC